MNRTLIVSTLTLGLAIATVAAEATEPPFSALDGSSTRSLSVVTPAAPTGLEARVYSATAGEIFWARPATVGLLYDVIRDGQKLVTTDGTSWFDDTLAPDRGYTYEIVAIDRQGRRSAGSRVSLETPSGIEGPPPGLAAPTGLEARVYSATAGEIFWARPATVGLLYDVIRDGQKLVTTDGTSWFDDTLAGGTRYTYEVIAIDRQGERSSTSSVKLTTLGGGSTDGGSVIDQNNRLEIVDRVLGLYAGKGYDAAILTGPDFVADNVAVSEEILDPRLDVTRSGYDCPDGGTATVTADIFSAGAGRSLDQRYADCGWNGRVRDGNVSFVLSPYGRYEWRYGGFSLRDGNGREVRVEGSVNRDYALTKVFFHDERRARLSRYTAEDEEGVLQLSDVDTTFRYGETGRFEEPTGRAEAASLVGSFDVRATWTGEATLAVTTPVPFVNPADARRRFPTGRLEIRAGDGSLLELDTEDGDGNPDTVALRLTIDGESETQSLSWDRWLDVLTFDDPDGYY